jgi:hypothetical protein
MRPRHEADLAIEYRYQDVLLAPHWHLETLDDRRARRGKQQPLRCGSECWSDRQGAATSSWLLQA